MASKTTGNTANAKTPLTSPNQSLGSVIDTLKKHTLSSVTSNYKQPEYTAVTDPTIRSASDLNNALGTDITYDRKAIEDVYNSATKEGYNAELQSQANAERNYTKNLANTQNTLIDTMRQQQGQAVSAGVNKGMQAANALSAVLGMSQNSVDSATQLAQDQQAIGTKYAGELANNGKEALNTANTVSQALATLSRQLYNDDIQSKTAELSYNQGINTDNAGVQSNLTNALATVLSNINTAGAGVYNNNNSAIAQIQAAIANAGGTRDAYTATAAANKYAADVSAQATKDAAQASADATKYSAQQAYGNNTSSGSATSSNNSSGGTVKSNYNGNSIVDGLKAAGRDASYSTRQQLATANGISNYRGTAAQNTKLLTLLKNGLLKTS